MLSRKIIAWSRQVKRLGAETDVAQVFAAIRELDIQDRFIIRATSPALNRARTRVRQIRRERKRLRSEVAGLRRHLVALILDYDHRLGDAAMAQEHARRLREAAALDLAGERDEAVELLSMPIKLKRGPPVPKSYGTPHIEGRIVCLRSLMFWCLRRPPPFLRDLVRIRLRVLKRWIRKGAKPDGVEFRYTVRRGIKNCAPKRRLALAKPRSSRAARR